jgi:serine/threonine protein kinase
MGVIAGVHYLHSYSPVIVHGDLKPVSSFNAIITNADFSSDLKRNIIVDDQRNARLCDFGISRALTAPGTSGLTTTSAHTGTERYLSYELVVAEDACSPTTASDVYALGCIGFEMSRDN